MADLSPFNATAASLADFVWATNASNIPAWRAASPATILGYYMKFTRDVVYNLSWWQAHNPSLVLYTCDRKTPAYECFAGAPACYKTVPLDLSNPGTLAYQLVTDVRPAAAAGYTALSLDNYDVENTWKACGVWAAPNRWVQLYTGAPLDAAYASTVLNWTARLAAEAHREGLLVIPNFHAYINASDPWIQGVVNAVDGVLDEGAWAVWGSGSDWRWNGQSYMTAARWENVNDLAASLARRGKAYYGINNWGPGTDYNANPSCIPYNISGDANRWVRQFFFGSHLLSKGDFGAPYLDPIQCYGGLWWWPEYSAAAPLGAPVGAGRREAATGVWRRDFAGGEVLLNPAISGSPPVTAVLDPAFSYTDLYGSRVASPLLLNATSAIVLLRSPRH